MWDPLSSTESLGSVVSSTRLRFLSSNELDEGSGGQDSSDCLSHLYDSDVVYIEQMVNRESDRGITKQ